MDTQPGCPTEYVAGGRDRRKDPAAWRDPSLTASGRPKSGGELSRISRFVSSSAEDHALEMLRKPSGGIFVVAAVRCAQLDHAVELVFIHRNPYCIGDFTNYAAGIAEQLVGRDKNRSNAE